MLDPDLIYENAGTGSAQIADIWYLPLSLGVYFRPGSKKFMKMLEEDPYKMKTYTCTSTVLGICLQPWIFLQAVLKISEVNAAVSPGKIPFSNALQIDFLKVSKSSSYCLKNDFDDPTLF
jgi:hypothetical protein